MVRWPGSGTVAPFFDASRDGGALRRGLMPKFFHVCWLVCPLEVLAIFLTARTALAAAPPRLKTDGDSQAGCVTLSWQASQSLSRPLTFELQGSATADFGSSRVIYCGPETSSVRSGLPDGTRYFRVRARSGQGPWGQWSRPAQFSVRHHSLVMASTLMGIGAIVFVATAWVVVRAQKAERP